ncbi:MAG: hypothetical protein ACW967_02735 [Candidatus Hodarchaeales archaeon]
MTDGQCDLCGGSPKCPLDDKIFNFLKENSFDPRIMVLSQEVKTKYANYTNENDYSSCIFLSEIKRN